MEAKDSIDLVISSLRGGGAERVCTTLANGFIQRGIKVRIIVLNLENAIFDKELSPDIELINLQKKHARSSFFAFAKYLRVNKPKVVLVFNSQLAVILVLMRMFVKFPFVIIARNINTLSEQRKIKRSFWHGYVVNIFLKCFYRKVNYTIAESEGMKRDLIKHYGFNTNIISVINNPVSPNIRNFSIKGCINKTIPKTVLFVGRLVEVKGLIYLIKGFSKVLNTKPDSMLKIVGQGPLLETLVRLTEKLGISEKVEFSGFIENIAYEYIKASVTVLTSISEGFPNVLLESITLGTPIVAFDCPHGPREIIQYDVNGYLVEYKNIDDLALKITRALERVWDQELVRQTADQYDLEQILDKHMEIIFPDDQGISHA